MSEGSEHLLPHLNKRPASQELVPQDIAERFITHTLGEGSPMKEMNNSSYWRALDKEVDVPGLGKARLVVDYRRYHGKDSGQSGFDQILFDYYAAEADEAGSHPSSPRCTGSCGISRMSCRTTSRSRTDT